MKWTKDKPTKPGFYLFVRTDGWEETNWGSVALIRLGRAEGRRDVASPSPGQLILWDRPGASWETPRLTGWFYGPVPMPKKIFRAPPPLLT